MQSHFSSNDHSCVPQLSFFQYFYNKNAQVTAPWKPLKEKYQNFKQQSYATPRSTYDVNFIKKFSQLPQYIPFISQDRAEKIQIPMLQEIIEVIYDEHEEFFVEGGWRNVKNKSLKTHLQQYLLLKLWRMNSSGKFQGGMSKLLLGFFYTLNYYKTCNYQIKLFNEFMMSSELDLFFIFILLRKKSRRVHKDLILKSQFITDFVQIIKGEKQSTPSLASYSSEVQDIGEVKLLLIYPEIIEYIQNNGVVLHQIMLFSLMEVSGLAKQKFLVFGRKGNSDWNSFLSLCFNELDEGGRSYHQELIARVVKANLKIANSLFKEQRKEHQRSSSEEESQQNERQKFLEETFGLLIKMLSSIIYDSQQCNQRWRKMYIELSLLYESNMVLGNKLVEEFLKSEQYYSIYSKYNQK